MPVRSALYPDIHDLPTFPSVPVSPPITPTATPTMVPDASPPSNSSGIPTNSQSATLIACLLPLGFAFQPPSKSAIAIVLAITLACLCGSAMAVPCTSPCASSASECNLSPLCQSQCNPCPAATCAQCLQSCGASSDQASCFFAVATSDRCYCTNFVSKCSLTGSNLAVGGKCVPNPGFIVLMVFVLLLIIGGIVGAAIFFLLIRKRT